MGRWWTVSAVALVALFIRAAPTSATERLGDFLSGMNLTTEEATALEERLERNPQDLQARSQLIVYYFPKSHLNGAVRRIHHEHVLWLIRSAPHADVLGSPHSQIQPFFDADSYRAGKQTWLSHIEREPSNVTFLGNAANFFSDFQDGDLDIETLQSAQSHDPDNSKWPTLLGHRYLRDALLAAQLRAQIKIPEFVDADDLPSSLADLFDQAPAGESSSSAALALEQFELAYERADSDIERTHLLDALARAAFEAERYDDARAHASALLNAPPTPASDGMATHRGNIILGRVALAEDDVERAKYHLLEAGKVSGSAPLGSFGPNMRLAADLLERGERDIVLEYFELCSNFWPSDKLKDWTALVRAGRTPDFEAHLFY